MKQNNWRQKESVHVTLNTSMIHVTTNYHLRFNTKINSLFESCQHMYLINFIRERATRIGDVNRLIYNNLFSSCRWGHCWIHQLYINISLYTEVTLQQKKGFLLTMIGVCTAIEPKLAEWLSLIECLRKAEKADFWIIAINLDQTDRSDQKYRNRIFANWVH